MGILNRLFGSRPASIDGARARSIVDAGGILVDVRTDAEWAAGHAPGARHIPLDQVDRAASSLPDGVRIVTICKSGVRSAFAARTLAAKGFDVSSVRGGMRAWSAAGGPVVTGRARGVAAGAPRRERS
ncbi:rhodanese-like domain-containing protein [Galbitalea soli]|uniref:Rhodanese-like domain-containing protein n=1 Tax=Galbitalea soli TaxID=1268042 RepID=A0A7C9TT50_9MICO|nr:rhodanese-like domain-containing protein [Galbitalea soli]NEM92421.1 rhodanese-like domain-containing protein [Galbitalea soli]NYJ29455.1 rhodanese-related sulfurtransferase [Galbitalea soli]